VTRVQAVSVLFSEPKIPQCGRGGVLRSGDAGFSALQRAENSSMVGERRRQRKSRRFSALQRAENSSMDNGRVWNPYVTKFQCSSASRKFLNPAEVQAALAVIFVSVLFSEPKIPQFWEPSVRSEVEPFQCSSASRKFLNYKALRLQSLALEVSVLFSEPKIPQCTQQRDVRRIETRFSALQRAENSSIRSVEIDLCLYGGFSALQRAENSSIDRETKDYAVEYRVSVLFSEPKIPQYIKREYADCVARGFSALQRAENSSISEIRNLGR